MSIKYAFKVILDGTIDITDKVKSFQITDSLDAYCREASLDILDETFFDSLDFSRIPENPRIEIFTSILEETPPTPQQVWVSQGVFFIERPTFQVGTQITETGIWGRQSTAILNEPFAQKITKLWSSNTTLYAILQEIIESVGLTWIEDNCELDNYNIFADTFEADNEYPIDVLKNLVNLCVGEEGFVTTDRLGNICIKKLKRTYPTYDHDITDSIVQTINEEPEWPEFGNRIKIIPNLSVSQNSCDLLIDRECLGTGASGYINVYAQARDGNSVPLNGVVINWLFEPAIPKDVWFKYPWYPNYNMEKTASQNTARMIVSNEKQIATGLNSVEVKFVPSSVIGIWSSKDASRSYNFAPVGGYLIDGNTIFLTQRPFTYCDQSVVISYYADGIAKNTIVYSEELYEDVNAEELYGSLTVIASVSGKDTSKEIYVNNSCKCKTELEVLVNPTTVTSIPLELSIIYGFLTNSGAPVNGTIRMIETSGYGTLQWSEKYTSSILFEGELTEAINIIPNQTQCIVATTPDSVVSVYRRSRVNRTRLEEINAEIAMYESHSWSVPQSLLINQAKYEILEAEEDETPARIGNDLFFDYETVSVSSWLKIARGCYCAFAISSAGQLFGCGSQGVPLYRPNGTVEPLPESTGITEETMPIAILSPAYTVYNIFNFSLLGLTKVRGVNVFALIDEATDWESIECNDYPGTVSGDISGFTSTDPFVWGIKIDHSLWGIGAGKFPNKIAFSVISNSKDWLSLNGQLALKTNGQLWGVNRNFGSWVNGELSVKINSHVLEFIDEGPWKFICDGVVNIVGIKTDGTLWGKGRIGSKYFLLTTSFFEGDPLGQGHDPAWYINDRASRPTSYIWWKSPAGFSYPWAYNYDSGFQVHKKEFVQIGSDSDWAYVECKDGLTLAIKENGTLWATGGGGSLNFYLEIYGIPAYYSLTQIGTDSDWKEVYIVCTPTYGIYGLKTDGSIWYMDRYTSFVQISDEYESYSSIDIYFNANAILGINDNDLYSRGSSNTGSLGLGTTLKTTDFQEINNPVRFIEGSFDGNIINLNTLLDSNTELIVDYYRLGVKNYFKPTVNQDVVSAVIVSADVNTEEGLSKTANITIASTETTTTPLGLPGTANLVWYVEGPKDVVANSNFTEGGYQLKCKVIHIDGQVDVFDDSNAYLSVSGTGYLSPSSPGEKSSFFKYDGNTPTQVITLTMEHKKEDGWSFSPGTVSSEVPVRLPETIKKTITINFINNGITSSVS